MKLGCSSYSFRQVISAGQMDQREWLRFCAEELALDGVELMDMQFPTTDTPLSAGLQEALHRPPPDHQLRLCR